MIDLNLNVSRRGRPRFLFIGAHSDDIEIGCGGTVVELLKRYPNAEITWVVLSGNTERAREARKSAGMMLRGVERKDILIEKFRDCFFPSEYPALKAFFEDVCKSFSPTVIFAHHRDDLHQDHRIVGELAWNTFRDHMILEYEIPKFDGGLGSPSFFVPLSAETVRRKLAVLTKAFGSQRSRQWFSDETFSGLMRLRGIECNASSGYAEAFYARKVILR